MSPLVLLLAMPALYWPEGVETAARLKDAGIDRIVVAAEGAAAWRRAGFAVTPAKAEDLAAREKLAAPGIVGRADLASATRAPWVTANGWRFLRKGGGRYRYEVTAGKASLAAAEGFAYGADAILKIDPADLAELGRMLAFLGALPAPELPALADVAVVDDGSFALGEVMNLMVRRNLLFRAVSKPTSELRVNIELGAKEYPRKDAADPGALALKVRRQLGDERRSLRLYGSDVVIGRLAGDGARLRLDLLNYGGREVESLRVRVRGRYAAADVSVAGLGALPMEDYTLTEDATEFSIPRLGPYAQVVLPAAP